MFYRVDQRVHVGGHVVGAEARAGCRDHAQAAHQRLRAVVIGAAEAALLEIAEGSPALHIHRVAFLGDGRRVEFTRSFYRSDTYDFVAELTLSASARARSEGAAR